MAVKTVDFSGRYQISAISADRVTFSAPAGVNPAWNYNDVKGAGSVGYPVNVTLIRGGLAEGVNLAGAYKVQTVTPTEITLVNPAGVNPDWGLLSRFPGLQTRLLSPYVAKSGGNWLGPFIVESADTTILVANFVAMGGLFKDNGKKQKAFPITVELEATPVDSSDKPVGAAQIFQTTIAGNSKGRDSRAATMVCQLTVPGRQSVRARRVTNADYSYEGTVVDEVKWKDLYGMGAVDMADFGNVTTVHTRTYATEGALSVKDRKLSMLVTRRVPTRISGVNFTAPAGTNNAADILTAICLDSYIGARKLNELDLDAIYDAVADAVAYFWHPDAGKFSFTFDDDNLSFQETAQIVASTVFSTAYRQGSTVRMQFEGARQDSSLLFNHRNKIPASETRTTRFGNLDNHDGVEFEYVAPGDDAPVTIYIPSDRSATNPRSVKGQGVRSHKQAYWQAWRAWNKIRYQNQTAEFSATQEAALVIRNERVLVADNTAAKTLDGEVEAQNGLELVLSQPAPIVGTGSIIFLQLPDGTTDAIPVTAGTDVYRVVLGRAPRLALAIGDDIYAPAAYQIVHDEDARSNAFLISEKDPEDTTVYTLRVVNYSSLYYANDQLQLWLSFVDASYFDRSAYERDGTAVGGSVLVQDAVRGKIVHDGAGAGSRVTLPAFDPPSSYTKAAWVNRDDLLTAGQLLSSANESFGFAAGANLQAGHGTVAVSAPWPAAGAWHHAAVVYDAADATMVLYINGVAVDDQAAVAVRALAQLTAFDGLLGRADDLRLIHRALEADEVRSIYRASRL